MDSDEERRGPGRPRKRDDDETRAAVEQARRRRRGGGAVTGKRLGVAESTLDFDRFAYRWINDGSDNPARLFSKTKEDDWDVVTNEGGAVKEDSTDLGAAVSVVVGSSKDGSPIRAYLCRKPKTYFDEDQAEKARELDRQLAELRRGNDRAGGAQADYVPQSGIRLGT